MLEHQIPKLGTVLEKGARILQQQLLVKEELPPH
jgi:hypothetical protein